MNISLIRRRSEEVIRGAEPTIFLYASTVAGKRPKCLAYGIRAGT
jgi:hypothetical protein